jgi:DNA-binding NtrC family response regulator
MLVGDDAELDTIKAVLTSCNGNKRMAARKLNWSRMTLYRKLAKYKLNEELGAPKTPASDEQASDGEKKLA